MQLGGPVDESSHSAVGWTCCTLYTVQWDGSVDVKLTHSYLTLRYSDTRSLTVFEYFQINFDLGKANVELPYKL